MNLPECPNVREQHCARSALRLAGESDAAWFFFCQTCHLSWTVSKPRARDQARWANAVDRTKRMTEAERAEASRARYFIIGSGIGSEGRTT